jgi:DHA2 family multidrug resistance protein
MEQTVSPSTPRPAYLPLGILAVLLGGLLSTLNGRLLTVAMPDLRGALHLSVDEAAWISTSYNMSLMFIAVFSVYLGALLGPRRVLLACSIVYAVACFLMPFAAGYSPLLVLQVIAGLSSGTFYPLTLSFILLNLPLRIAHIGLAVYSITILFSANIASTVSAWNLSVFSWHWTFWNAAWIAPIMGLCVYFGMPRTPLPQSSKNKPSWRGLLYWSCGFALIYGALDEGERVHWFNSASFAALLISGAFLILLSIVRRKQDPNPFIALPFLRNRSTILLAVMLFCFRFFLLATALLIPQFLSGVKGLRDEQIGPTLGLVALLQFGIAWVVAFTLRGVNSRLIMAGGYGLIGITAFFCSRLTVAWAPSTYIPYAVLLAVGESFAMLGLVACIVLQVLGSGAVSPQGKAQRPFDLLTFSSFFHTVRVMGGQVGAVLMVHLLNERTKFHVNVLTDETGLDRSPVFAFLHAVGANAGGYLLGLKVKQQASTLAFGDMFMVMAWASIVALVLLSFVRLSITNFKEIA